MAERKIIIERLPMRTSPQDRLNSYNHHALAPWLAETGYITPLYLHHREALRTAFNMARWLTPAVQKHMLAAPEAILELSSEQIETLLTVAAISDYGKKEEIKTTKILGDLEYEFGPEPLPERQCECFPAETFFVRMSTCSPKDSDGGNQKAVETVYEALFKIISSKRTVQTLIDLLAAPDYVDNKIYFFPYRWTLDKMSEWRCFVYHSRVVAISQSRFYQGNYDGIEDEALETLVRQAQTLWDDIAPELSFDSCILDLYAEVRKPEFQVRLIEMNPWGPYLGTGSMLFHWLDDTDILEPKRAMETPVVVRIVKPGNAESAPIDRDTAFKIGRSSIINDELSCLKKRGLLNILENDEAVRLMRLPVPGAKDGNTLVTRRGALKRFKREFGLKEKDGREAVQEETALQFHPRFLKVQQSYRKDLEKESGRLKEIEQIS